MIYLLRHGETDANAKGICAGVTEYSLNERGISQAKETNAFLLEKTKRFNRVFCSPSDRALQTMLFATRDIEKNTAQVTSKLKELHFGVAENEKWEDTMSRYPEIYKEVLTNPTPETRYPGGESIGELTDRCLAFLEEINDVEGENILIVSHGATIKMLAALLTEKKFKDFNYVDNCSLSIIGKGVFEYNFKEHLSDVQTVQKEINRALSTVN